MVEDHADLPHRCPGRQPHRRPGRPARLPGRGQWRGVRPHSGPPGQRDLQLAGDGVPRPQAPRLPPGLGCRHRGGGLLQVHRPGQPRLIHGAPGWGRGGTPAGGRTAQEPQVISLTQEIFST